MQKSFRYFDEFYETYTVCVRNTLSLRNFVAPSIFVFNFHLFPALIACAHTRQRRGWETSLEKGSSAIRNIRLYGSLFHDFTTYLSNSRRYARSRTNLHVFHSHGYIHAVYHFSVPAVGKIVRSQEQRFSQLRD